STIRRKGNGIFSCRGIRLGERAYEPTRPDIPQSDRRVVAISACSGQGPAVRGKDNPVAAEMIDWKLAEELASCKVPQFYCFTTRSQYSSIRRDRNRLDASGFDILDASNASSSHDIRKIDRQRPSLSDAMCGSRNKSPAVGRKGHGAYPCVIPQLEGAQQP